MFLLHKSVALYTVVWHILYQVLLTPALIPSNSTPPLFIFPPPTPLAFDKKLVFFTFNLISCAIKSTVVAHYSSLLAPNACRIMWLIQNKPVGGVTISQTTYGCWNMRTLAEGNLINAPSDIRKSLECHIYTRRALQQNIEWGKWNLIGLVRLVYQWMGGG